MAEKDNKKIIKINDRFSLAYDDNGDKWIIEAKISDKGKRTEKVYCGYHWHFDTLLQSFVKKRMPEQEAATVKWFGNCTYRHSKSKLYVKTMDLIRLTHKVTAKQTSGSPWS